MSRSWRLAFLLCGLALLAGLVWAVGPADILAMVRRIGWSGLPIVGLYAAYHLLGAVALQACVLRSGVLRFRDALGVRLAGESLQVLTAGGPVLGEPAKAWLLGSRGLTLTESFAATLTEYLIYTFVSAALMIAVLGYLVAFVPVPRAVGGVALILLAVAAIFLVASMAAILRRFYLIGAIVSGIGRLPIVSRRVNLDITAVHRMEDLLLEILHERPARFAWVALIQTLAHLLLVAELGWLLLRLGLPSPVGNAWLLDIGTKATGLAFFFVPGQIGAAEGVYAVACQALGLPVAAGVAISLVRRLRSLATAAAGLGTFWVLSRTSRGWRRSAHRGPA